MEKKTGIDQFTSEQNGSDAKVNIVNDGNETTELLAGFSDWFRRNNPFYLISVLLMFCGLYLASMDSKVKGADALETLISFYVIQNIYEIAILAMALYLLKNRINQRHGNILLFFLVMFLSEATMYQSAITSVCSKEILWISFLVSFIYFFLAAAKVFAVIHYLKLRIRPAAVFFALSAFLLIYLSPQYMNALLVSKRSGADLLTAGSWEIYYIWLAAALIQLPFIISSWKKTPIAGFLDNAYVGCENKLYRTLVLIPFIVLPVQLVLNLHPDMHSLNPNIVDFCYCTALYIYFGSFFIEALYRQFIEDAVGVNYYNFACGIFILMFIFITRPVDLSVFGNYMIYPHRINVFMIALTLTAVSITRENRMCAGLLCAIMFYYAKNLFMFTIQQTYDYAVYRSTPIVRAAMIITLSFLTLGAGFALSVSGNKKSEKL